MFPSLPIQYIPFSLSETISCDFVFAIPSNDPCNGKNLCLTGTLRPVLKSNKFNFLARYSKCNISVTLPK